MKPIQGHVLKRAFDRTQEAADYNSRFWPCTVFERFRRHRYRRNNSVSILRWRQLPAVPLIAFGYHGRGQSGRFPKRENELMPVDFVLDQVALQLRVEIEGDAQRLTTDIGGMMLNSLSERTVKLGG